MDKVLEFGKRYGAWIAAGVVGTVIAVAAVAAVRSMPDEDDVVVLEELPEGTDEESSES